MRSTSTSNSSSSKMARSMQASWLGETTALVQFLGESASNRKSEQGLKSLKRPADTINVLFNPSRRPQKAVPSSLLSCGLFRTGSKVNALAGPTRNLEDLPEIHYVLLSHTELEELDTATLLGLYKRDSTTFIVASGAYHNLVKAGIPSSQIIELESFKDEVISHSATRSLRVTLVPAIANKGPSSSSKHTASRVSHWIVQHENILSEKLTTEDSTRSTVLFVASSSRRAYARGQSDPSVNDLWKNVQTRYGPLDLAFIPVWAGKPEATSFLKKIFSSKTANQIQDYSPIEAADMHQSLRSSLSIAMIHGLKARTTGSPFDDDHEDEDPSSSIKTPLALQAITQLKSACDRTERRSVEFRRGQGSIKRKNRNGKSGKSTFAVLSEGQSVSL